MIVRIIATFMTKADEIRAKWELVRGSLHERARREWAAAEALALGWGGLKTVQEATGLAAATIIRGKNELRARAVDGSVPTSIRAPGAGRKTVAEKYPGLVEELEQLVDPVTRGDPDSPLRWTAKSLRRLAAEMLERGFRVGAHTISKLLKQAGYSLQSNRKRLEGRQHVDRDAQFHYINTRVAEQLGKGSPAVSVDTKKKELVGNYKNRGVEWRPQGKPVDVQVHDFIGDGGKVNPYGVYDILADRGWVNVGITSDTAEFAVESIRRWWTARGREMYPNADELLITADGGGSNGYRVRLWKLELQRLANDIGIPITACHLPPGTSKWNKIEHRLFAFIAMNWRGQPLTDHATILKLISSTTNSKGLVVEASLDTTTYLSGRKVSDMEMTQLCLDPHAFHPEWNYTIHPAAPQLGNRQPSAASDASS